MQGSWCCWNLWHLSSPIVLPGYLVKDYILSNMSHLLFVVERSSSFIVKRALCKIAFHDAAAIIVTRFKLTFSKCGIVADVFATRTWLPMIYLSCHWIKLSMANLSLGCLTRCRGQNRLCHRRGGAIVPSFKMQTSSWWPSIEQSEEILTYAEVSIYNI